MINHMVMVLKYGKINLDMKDIIFMAKNKVLENTFGMMDRHMLDIGRRTY